MKIRTITCHHVYNHGALLQAYALTEFLKGEGHDVSIIDYRPPYLDGHFNLWRSNSRYNRIGLGWAYVLSKLPGRIRALKRKKAFDTFFDQYIPVTDLVYHSIDELRANPPKADLYIAGSDQIWNTEFKNGKDPSFYLDFGTPKRKISYAASFATERLKDNTEDFIKEKLKCFDAISVRESSALCILEHLGISGELVADPVFLIDKEKWDSLDSHDGENENYILTYDFETHESTIGIIAHRLAKIYGCNVYSVGPYRMRYANKSFVNVGPASFVTLIKNARCIVSNSFHGSAFSMIYGKDFFVVNRKDGLNVRMWDLLNHYGIKERLIAGNVTQEQLVSHIDYNKVSKLLQCDTERSKLFLSTQIRNAHV